MIFAVIDGIRDLVLKWVVKNVSRSQAVVRNARMLCWPLWNNNRQIDKRARLTLSFWEEGKWLQNRNELE